jgi:hypothetical protein
MKTYRFSASTPKSHCGNAPARRHCGVVSFGHHCGIGVSRHHCGANDRPTTADEADDSFILAAAKRGSGHHCAPRYS